MNPRPRFWGVLLRAIYLAVSIGLSVRLGMAELEFAAGAALDDDHFDEAFHHLVYAVKLYPWNGNFRSVVGVVIWSAPGVGLPPGQN